MKKAVVALLFIAMVAMSMFTVSAAISPELPTGGSDPSCPQICRRWPRRGGYDYDYCYTGGGYGGGIIYSGSGGGGVTVMDMSPKTGYSDNYAVLAVFGILMCTGMAVYSGKKMREKN